MEWFNAHVTGCYVATKKNETALNVEKRFQNIVNEKSIMPCSEYISFLWLLQQIIIKLVA